MVAELAPERDFRRPGCSDDCRPIKAIIPGQFGRSELMLHDPESHEEYGRWLAGGTDPLRALVVTGRLAVDLLTFETRVDGELVKLTPTEQRILRALARRVGSVTLHEDVIREAFGESWGEQGAVWLDSKHTLRCNVARIRLAIGPASTLIRTVVGFGYRLEMAEVGTTLPPQEDVTFGGRRIARWAIAWDRCRRCARTDSRHQCHGYCTRCEKYARAHGLDPFGRDG